MKNLFYLPIIVLAAFILLSFKTKKSYNNDEVYSNNQITNNYYSKQDNNKITINGSTYNLISDPCVPQDSDEVKMLTFKGNNDDLGYSLSVTIASYDSAVNEGKYVYSNGESKVNFVVITLVTDDATYVGNSGFVNYKKNANSGTLFGKDLTLIDSFENLPNIVVSFNIVCDF